MKTIIQRVQWAKVVVDDQVVGEIGPGVLTLLGVGHGDTEQSVEWMIQKILKLRIFEDDAGKMNRSLLDVSGEHLIVSQFTLYGDCRKGNRPSFVEAGAPDLAERLYQHAIQFSQEQGIKTESGRFQADMKVSLLNDGPVTFEIDSP